MKNANFKKWSSKLKSYANIAIYTMAIFGFIQFFFNGINKIYQTITFKNVLGIVRPICEPIIFPMEYFGLPNSNKKIFLIGASIEPLKDLSNVRISFNHLENIVCWAVRSDAIPIKEQDDLLKKLPIGEVHSFVSPPINNLLAETTTIISAIMNISTDEFILNNDMINVFSNQGKLLHVDLINRQIRGMSIMLTPEQWLLISLSVVLIYLIVKKSKQKKTSKRKI